MRRFRLIPVAPFSPGFNVAITAPAPMVAAEPAPPPTGPLFAAPDHEADLTAFALTLFTDAALTTAPGTPASTATVTHVKAYAAANADAYDCTPDVNNCTFLHWAIGHDETGDGACGVNFNVPWGFGRDSTMPPPQGAVIAEGDCSVSFDPTGALDATTLPPLAFIPGGGGGTINGVGGPWTLILSITTDLGDCVFVCGNQFCV